MNTRSELGRIWSEQNKYAQWLEVELAASEALAELGEVPVEAAQLIRDWIEEDILPCPADKFLVASFSRQRHENLGAGWLGVESDFQPLPGSRDDVRGQGNKYQSENHSPSYR